MCVCVPDPCYRRILAVKAIEPPVATPAVRWLVVSQSYCLLFCKIRIVVNILWAT